MPSCTLKCLGSSSAGNCYILDCGGDKLLLELGVHFNQVLKELKYEEGLRSVRGCLTTHL